MRLLRSIKNLFVMLIEVVQEGRTMYINRKK